MVRRRRAIRQLYSSFFLFLDMVGDCVDQGPHIPRFLQGAIHGDVNVELFFQGGQDHHDINRFQVKALNCRIWRDLRAIDHPLGDYDIDNVGDEFLFILETFSHIHLYERDAVAEIPLGLDLLSYWASEIKEAPSPITAARVETCCIRPPAAWSRTIRTTFCYNGP